MIKSEVLIVGGGPAGSTCAWQLAKNGIDCIILDKYKFPRAKLCAGWITPQVLKYLQFSVEDYLYSILTLPSIQIQVKGIRIKYPFKQYSIRRYEFDNWLLKRSKAKYVNHFVKSIIKKNGQYVVDNQFQAKYLVGAGGTNCPVHKKYFDQVNPRIKESLIVALEQEFKYDYTDDKCYLWFLRNNLPGYAWYVPKENGYLNVGIGAYKYKLSQYEDSIKKQWINFTNMLDELALVTNTKLSPTGCSYYLRNNNKTVHIDNVFIVGDSAGLATVDMGEGIGPAVQSGLLVAEAILNNNFYSIKSIKKFSIKFKPFIKSIEFLSNTFAKRL